MNKNLKNLYKQWGAITCLSVQTPVFLTINQLLNCFIDIKNWIIHHWAVFMRCIFYCHFPSPVALSCMGDRGVGVPCLCYYSAVYKDVKSSLHQGHFLLSSKCQNAAMSSPLDKYCVVTMITLWWKHYEKCLSSSKNCNYHSLC